MFKNTASQKLVVYAYDSTTNSPKTGDAANITAYLSKDYGAVTVLTDTSATEMDSTNAKGYYLFDVTQAETNFDVGVVTAKSGTANIVVLGAPDVIHAVPNIYHADIQFTRDPTNSQEEYSITWFKNGVRQTSGITVPTIQVIKRSDGTDLIASTTPTQIGSTGSYKYDATGASRLTLGEAALAVVTATIDGATRTFSRIVGRDST